MGDVTNLWGIISNKGGGEEDTSLNSEVWGNLGTWNFYGHPSSSPHPISWGFYSLSNQVPDPAVADLPWLGLEECGIFTQRLAHVVVRCMGRSS